MENIRNDIGNFCRHTLLRNRPRAFRHDSCQSWWIVALILGVNYFCRDTSRTVTVRAEIVRVYSETRYRSKRVARNRYTRGEPYKVYFMDARLSDGRECKRSISIQRYNRYAWNSHRNKPDSVDLHLSSGALGMEILER